MDRYFTGSTWKIKILSVANNSEDGDIASWVGIVVDDEELLEKYQDNFNWSRNGCQLCAGSGALYSSMEGISKSRMLNGYIHKWTKKSDILEMKLDLNQQTLSYKVNDTDIGAAFTNLKQTAYRLAWSTYIGEESAFMITD